MKKVSHVFFLLWLALGAAISGCVSTKYFPAQGAGKYPPSDTLEEFRNYPGRPYTVIGTITALGRSQQKIMEKIRARAMKAGAHAIVVKPPARITQQFESQRRKEFGKSEWKYEAILIRFED